MDFGEPKGITHPNSTVLAYYNSGEVFGHRVIDAKTMYNSEPDLTGHLQCFIKNMFQEACDEPLPKDLEALSNSQANTLGIGTSLGKTLNYTLGETEVLATYDSKDELGFAYIFDQRTIHQITSNNSSQERFFSLIQSLKKDSLKPLRCKLESRQIFIRSNFKAGHKMLSIVIKGLYKFLCCLLSNTF